jgi:hydroxymethylpyrimidine kinase/phosphomethylpyrimidine kinase
LHIPNISVVTSLVVQNPIAVNHFVPVDLNTIKEQILTLLNYYDVRIVNIGLLGSLDVLDIVLPLFEKKPIILDPIFFSGSGDFQFVKQDQINRLKTYLSHIFLLTPNIPEAIALTGQKIKKFNDIQKVSRILMDNGVKNVLIKGGHLQGDVIYDTLFEGDQVFRFSSSRKQFRIHGTGSFLNAAIAAYLFLGEELKICVDKAKCLLNMAIENVNEENPILNLHF